MRFGSFGTPSKQRQKRGRTVRPLFFTTPFLHPHALARREERQHVTGLPVFGLMSARLLWRNRLPRAEPRERPAAAVPQGRGLPRLRAGDRRGGGGAGAPGSGCSGGA